jgi:N utilization substance protein B
MNRHFARIVAMQSLYEWDFRGKQKDEDPISIFERNCNDLESAVDGDFASHLINTVTRHREEIDKMIAAAAPEWPFEQIALLDRNIIRVAVAEILYDKNVPPRVAINEAIELSKTYGSETSSKFVNGVIGTIYRQSDRYDAETSSKNN